MSAYIKMKEDQNTAGSLQLASDVSKESNSHMLTKCTNDVSIEAFIDVLWEH